MSISHLVRAVFVPLLVVLGPACGDGGPTESTPAPLVAAVVDGARWEANHQVDLAVADLLQQGQVLEVVGLRVEPDGSTRQITVGVPSYRGPGTYTLGDPGTAGYAYYVTRSSQTAEPTAYFTDAQHTGTITVSAVDTQKRQLSGTFSFRARLQDGATAVTVTAGRFRGRYVVE